MRLSFAHRKATQALNFFARQAGGRISKMKALKLIYFADRYHLRRYGRPVTNDEYLAMEYGPVPSGCKDLAEMSSFLDDHERSYAEQFIAPEGERDVRSVKDVETDVFSQTDLEALGFSWNWFGAYDQFQLAEIAHGYPEWKRHETALACHDVSRVRMSYRHFLENPAGAVTDPTRPLSDEERRLREEDLDDLEVIESIWA